MPAIMYNGVMKTTSSNSRIILGIVLLILGATFLLSELGLLHFSLGEIIREWWPLAVIATGVIILFNNPQTFVFPLIVIVAGFLLQFRQLGLLEFNIWSLVWPSALLVIGLSLLFERKQGSVSYVTKENDDDDEYDTKQVTSDDKVSVLALFSGSEVKNTSRNFQGGDASAAFGAFEVDLRGASFKKEAALNVFAIFGGGDIIVPEGWRIETNGLPIFGGWENKTKQPTNENAPTLYIRGTCLFGGISIRHKHSSSSS